MTTRPTNPGGAIPWQSYTWGQLIQALSKDSQFDATTDILPGTIEQQLKSDVVWQDIPFNATNWQNFNAGTGGGNGVHFQYAVDPLGFVHIRGFIKSVAGYVFGTPATLVIGTLPVGARPSGVETGLMYQQDTTPAQTIIRLNILGTDGTIRLAEGITGPANNGNVGFGVLIIPPFQQVN